MASIVEGINPQLGKVLVAAPTTAASCSAMRWSRAARSGIGETVSKLVPQIRHCLRTGFVAAGKVINLYIRELYSIVRGKVGRSVELGLSWGNTRLRGGFVLATMAGAKKDLSDATFAVQEAEQIATRFGKAPRSYAYDRAGHSPRNVDRVREIGVRDVGLSPRATRRGR